MTWIRRPSACLRLTLAGWVLLSVAGCAGTGLFGPPGGRVADTGYGVPDYVRNLPKSRTGNMDEYTVFGKRYRVMDSAANFTEQGTASWYGKKFHGRKTSSGEPYDMYAMTAAHKHLPLPTYVRVTNLENNRSVVVKVNDRGPFIGDRIIDMSYTAAHELGMAEQGIARVRVDALSTHLIAENDSSSALSVAKAFGSQSSSRPATAPLNGPLNGPPVSAPPVVATQLAAVPLPMPVQVVAQFESESRPQVAAAASVALIKQAEPVALADPEHNISVDSSDDGFVELTPRRTATLAGDYYIQLGAFSQPPNAAALVVNVAEQTGLPAYVEKDANRKLYRVKMGPFQQGAVLENALTTLESIGIDGYTKLAVNR